MDYLMISWYMGSIAHGMNPYKVAIERTFDLSVEITNTEDAVDINCTNQPKIVQLNDPDSMQLYQELLRDNSKAKFIAVPDDRGHYTKKMAQELGIEIVHKNEIINFLKENYSQFLKK